jgi:hypothetical protein
VPHARALRSHHFNCCGCGEVTAVSITNRSFLLPHIDAMTPSLFFTFTLSPFSSTTLSLCHAHAR